MDSSVTSIDSDGRRERPLSMVSSISTDAGYHPDTDTEFGTLREEDLSISLTAQSTSSHNTDNSVVNNEENGNETSEQNGSDGDEQVTLTEVNSGEVSSAGSTADGSNNGDRVQTEDNNNRLDIAAETTQPADNDVIDNTQSSHVETPATQSKEVSLEIGLNVTFDKAECEDTKESKLDVEDTAVPPLNLDDSHDDTLLNSSNHNISMENDTVEQNSDSDAHNTSVESVPIVEVEVVDDNESARSEKSDDKEPSEKEQTDEKSGAKEDKKAKVKTKNAKTNSATEDKKNIAKNVKKADSNKVTSKIDNKLAAKVTTKRNLNTDNKVSSTKTSPRVGSKIADYIKKPNTGLLKEENIDNKKLSKNVVNKRKASMPDVKRNSITVMPVSVIAKDRRMSMPASKTDLHTSSKMVGSKSVISENGEEGGKKPVKRTPPKSKWDNIMSNINNGKDATKPKPKTEVKSRLNVTKTTKSTTSTNAGRPSVSTSLKTPGSSTTGTVARKPSPSPKQRTGLSPSGSRASSTDRTTSKITSRPTSAAKPGNKTTETLKKSRDRSTSVDSQSSVETSISQISSQGSKARTTRTSTPEPPKSTLATKRKSMIESRTGTKPLSAAELRRASVAGTAGKGPAAKKKEALSTGPASARKPTNQNRNKTTKPGTKQPATKKSNQPDVVSNSLTKASAAAEISRLEALCETRTKELNYTRMQLKAGLSAFDGMAVLVRYLTEQLDAFSCPQAKADLEEVQQQLAKGHAQIAELQEEKSSLEEEVSNLKKQHEEAVQKLEEEKQQELKTLQETLNKEKEEEFNKIHEKHSNELHTLKAFNERNLKDLKREHETILEEKEEQHIGEIQQHMKDHEKRVAELKQHHESKLADMTMTFERIKLALSEKLEMMRVECDEMKRREKQYMEQCQRDADIKVQVALEPYKHISAEIESLKTVLEMRNQDIHKLRTEKNELIKDLEELPKARDQITALERKVENLDAIINIKSDYEKQLSEKHSVLMRKYDRESKANKRLSMEAEELTWRLSMGETGHVPGFTRQVSHSPTNSNTTTPEPTRKIKPGAISPRCSGEFRGVSPRNSGEFGSAPRSPRSPNGKMSPRSPTSRVMNDPPKEVPPFTKILRSPESPLPATNIGDQDTSPSNGEPKSNLKRSGTYDLLDQKGRSSDDEDSLSKNSQEEDSLADDVLQQADV